MTKKAEVQPSAKVLKLVHERDQAQDDLDGAVNRLLDSVGRLGQMKLRLHDVSGFRGMIRTELLNRLVNADEDERKKIEYALGKREIYKV